MESGSVLQPPTAFHPNDGFRACFLQEIEIARDALKTKLLQVTSYLQKHRKRRLSVLLGGSSAHGQHTSVSDLDLAIVFSNPRDEVIAIDIAFELHRRFKFVSPFVYPADASQNPKPGLPFWMFFFSILRGGSADLMQTNGIGRSFLLSHRARLLQTSENQLVHLRANELSGCLTSLARHSYEYFSVKRGIGQFFASQFIKLMLARKGHPLSYPECDTLCRLRRSQLYVHALRMNIARTHGYIPQNLRIFLVDTPNFVPWFTSMDLLIALQDSFQALDQLYRLRGLWALRNLEPTPSELKQWL